MSDVIGPGGSCEKTISDNIDIILDGYAQEEKIFPEVSNIGCAMTSGAVNNTYSAWAEIVDAGATTLSSKFASLPGRLSGFLVEAVLVPDNFCVELAYGDSKTIIGRIRFKAIPSGAVSGFCLFFPLRTPQIPAGETLYYRAMCETGGSGAAVSFKYYNEA